MTIALSDTMQPSEELQQFLGLSLPPDTQVLISTHQLVEILNLLPQQITPIPGVPPQVVGACNWRGEVLWLIDLGQLLGKTPLFQLLQQEVYHAYYSVVVIQCHGYTIGLVVDQVKQIHDCDQQSLLKPTLPNRSTLPPCVEGYLMTPNGEALWLLNCESLLNFFRTSVSTTQTSASRLSRG
jgi:positive phototaxis protein PixI